MVQQYKFMLQKLKDGANKLKAKIGGDELDEKLVEVVSEENWQASTHQLHQIANAAYNYEKWQRINQFIWEKLKKSKSWKKILKTFNLIEFLLKNGPPSIISNFKYDLYQLRVFESYSNYIDGLDKGEPIRERAKIVVGLLSNEEQLEEERLKAKNIREKMSNVVGGSSGYGGGSGYDNYGGSRYGGQRETKKKPETGNNSYNYGNAVGHFGDYGYNKSTIDKYRDAKNEKPSTLSTSEAKKEEKKPEIQVETKKPFEKIASKLSKPGERKPVESTSTHQPVPTTTTASIQNNNSNIIDFDIMGSEPSKPQEPQSVPFTFESTAIQPTPTSQPQPVQPIQAPIPAPQPLPQTQPPVSQQSLPQTLPQQPFLPYNQPQPYGQQPFYGQQPNYSQQPNYGQPINYGQPNYGQGHQMGGQFGGFNQFGQPQTNYGMAPQAPGYGGMGQGANQQGYNQYINPMYPTTAPIVAGQIQQQQNKGSLNGGMQISLSTAKKEQEFGNFASSSQGTAEKVNWLSSTEKGLIDFSDFGNEINKKDPKASQSNVASNNIQIDAWSW